jgi:putative exporter of polyketide antibiotics
MMLSISIIAGIFLAMHSLGAAIMTYEDITGKAKMSKSVIFANTLTVGMFSWILFASIYLQLWREP